jgi:hypothetical protein
LTVWRITGGMTWSETWIFHISVSARLELRIQHLLDRFGTAGQLHAPSQRYENLLVRHALADAHRLLLGEHDVRGDRRQSGKLDSGFAVGTGVERIVPPEHDAGRLGIAGEVGHWKIAERLGDHQAEFTIPAGMAVSGDSHKPATAVQPRPCSTRHFPYDSTADFRPTAKSIPVAVATREKYHPMPDPWGQR